MGQSESSEYEYGLRIMGIDPKSPLSQEISLYTDFILQVNEFKDIKNLELFKEYILNTESETLDFQIYNIISNTLRTVSIENQKQPLLLNCYPEERETSYSKILRVMAGIFQNLNSSA